MPITPTEKTWYTDLSLDLSVLADTATSATTAAKSILWAWKAILMGQIGTNTQGLWTCVGSSPGDGTSNMSGTDTWTSTYTASKLVRATAGSNHSWICLKSPSGLGGTGVFHYIVIDWSTASDATVNLAYGRVAPTGGTATARPTMTNEWTYTTHTFFDGTATTHKIHRATTATGEHHILLSKTAASKFVTAMSLMEVTAEGRATDTYKCVSYVDHNVTHGPWEPAQGSMNATTPYVRGRYYDGSASTTMCLLEYTENNSSATSPNVSQTTTNPFDGLADDYPLFCNYIQSSFRGKKGRISDVFFAYKASSHPTVYPASGTASHHLSGSCWLPLGGGTATL